MLGKSLVLSDGTMDLITVFNAIRGDLTHPKTYGHDIYAKLETIDPSAVIGAVAEYIVCFHEAAATRYPYWIFGWNYLNPRPDSCEIIIINDQQFSFSLHALGCSVPASAHWEAEAWRDRYLGNHEGYRAVRGRTRKVSKTLRTDIPPIPISSSSLPTLVDARAPAELRKSYSGDAWLCAETRRGLT